MLSCAGGELEGISFSEHVVPLVSAAVIPWAAKQVYENFLVSSKLQKGAI